MFDVLTPCDAVEPAARLGGGVQADVCSPAVDDEPFEEALLGGGAPLTPLPPLPPRISSL